ncbi:hypothetical protein F2P81_020801 [Scophthalmus maximus]|uniref:Uncharacterized protein n=1 Tax=Scophthalmus maximus TaxID=52904 RepID=A0A6A4S680_SCOMX|nr:hypothetical protein F2P81_020801 [Scophthalmus maximus]
MTSRPLSHILKQGPISSGKQLLRDSALHLQRPRTLVLTDVQSVGGSSWSSPSSSREFTNATSDLTCRDSMILAEARFQIEATGCPGRLLGRGPATQAVKSRKEAWLNASQSASPPL